MTELDLRSAAQPALDAPPQPRPTADRRPARSALPTQPRSYPHFLRTPRARWWRGALAILSLVVGYLIISVAFGAAALLIDNLTGRVTWDAYASGQVRITPVLFLANNLSLAALIPLSMLLQWAFFGQRPRWLSSVQGRFRWRWFGQAALIVVPLWAIQLGVAYLIAPLDMSRVATDAAFLIIVIVATTPFQAAGEEYSARGLIARAAGSWSARPGVALVLGLVVSAVLFIIAHVASDPWLLGYYFFFGITVGVIAWRTGGLEVPVLIHAVNNVFFLLPTAIFADLSSVFDRGPGTGGPFVLLRAATLVVAAVSIEWWSRRQRVVRLGAPAAVRHG